MNLASQYVPFLQLLLSKFISEALPFCKKELKTKHVATDTIIIIIHTFLKNFYLLSKLWQVGRVMAGKRIQQSLKDQERPSGIWLSFKNISFVWSTTLISYIGPWFTLTVSSEHNCLQTWKWRSLAGRSEETSVAACLLIRPEFLIPKAF